MTYAEVRESARNTILNCKACPECNGLACGNTMPGPGSKAPGNGANANWKAWQEIRLNMDVFALTARWTRARSSSAGSSVCLC